MITDPSDPAVSVTTHQAPPPSEHRGDSTNPPALIVVHSADAASIGRVIALGDQVVAVGRETAAPDVCLKDAQLSRVHFRVGIDQRTGKHRVGDARSRNGTFVDGCRVDSALLSDGSVLRSGESVFVYGDPDPLARLHERVARVAASDLAVLLAGETGTGKERLAHAVHDQSGRTGPFVTVNCASFSRELLAAELFGHTRGAFSGATTARAGLFRAAEGGTLFLDEIGDFPLDLQPILLRALQEGAVRPLGTDQEIRVNVRIVAATHVDLDEAVRKERFRADLHSRLARVVVRLPPLRERRATVLALAHAVAGSAGGTKLLMTANGAEALVRHDWPYNVRELESLVQAFLTTEPEAPLDLAYLRRHHPRLCSTFRSDEASESPSGSSGTSRDRPSLEALLVRHAGNVSNMAEELGKPRAQIYRWLKAVGLDPNRFRTKA
jgi:transcriptional regulator with GAF, ATPase, and Fis domain